MRNPAVEAAGGRVEKFASPPGRLFGLLVMVLAAVLVVFLLAGDPGRDYKAIIVCLLLAALSWVVLVRPAVSANDNGVLLHNMLRDIFVPWSRIDRVRVLHTLQLVTDENRHFHGLGISRSSRQMLRQSYGRSSLLSSAMTLGLGSAPVETRADPVNPGGRARGVVYQDYVESRIERLARDSKPGALEPVLAWSWTSFAVLAAAIVFGVLLLV